MRLYIRVLGVEVLDIALGHIAEGEVSDEDSGTFEFAGDAAPLVQEVGIPADALTGFYQPPAYEDDDRRRQ